MTTAGDLRERVHLQRRGTAEDGFGGTTAGAFATVHSCAAKFQPLRGTESVMASRLQGRQPYVITVRYSAHSSAIDGSWRIEDARKPGRLFNVTSATDPDGSRQWLEILAVEGSANGE